MRASRSQLLDIQEELSSQDRETISRGEPIVLNNEGFNTYGKLKYSQKEQQLLAVMAAIREQGINLT